MTKTREGRGASMFSSPSLLCWGATTTSGCKAHCDLEWVVDPPLKTSESSDHEDSCSKTLPESIETNLTVDLSGLNRGWFIAFTLVDDGDHSVSRVGHDSAEDTSPVSWCESDWQLSWFAVAWLWCSQDIIVNELDGVLKCTELHHGVWHLTEPEWLKSLVETSPAAFCHHLGPSFAGCCWESSQFRSLHFDFEL